jgi:uncharacterized protein
MGVRLKLTFGAMLVAGLLIGAPVRAVAQTDPGTIIPSLELNQADVRDALRALFRNVGVSYTIAPDVQGTVTVSLRNVPFETALRNILGQVDATYRIEGGVYQIIRRELVAPPTPGMGGVAPVAEGRVVRRIRIRSADPAFIAQMLSGSQDYLMAPELSTVQKGGSIGGGFGGGGGGFGGGGGRYMNGFGGARG